MMHMVMYEFVHFAQCHKYLRIAIGLVGMVLDCLLPVPAREVETCVLHLLEADFAILKYDEQVGVLAVDVLVSVDGSHNGFAFAFVGCLIVVNEPCSCPPEASVFYLI